MSNVRGKKPVVKAETQAALLTAYDAVLAEQRQEFLADLQEQQDAVTADINEQREAWKTELGRIKEQDTYDFNKSKRDREDALATELSGRVAAVAKREDAVAIAEATAEANQRHYDELEGQVATFDAELTKAHALGVQEGQASAKKDYDTDLRIAKANFDADKKVLDNQVETLTAANKSHEATISALRAELVEANKRVETVATNAVNAAGNAKVTVQNVPNK
jgi:hypothetical protein